MANRPLARSAISLLAPELPSGNSLRTGNFCRFIREIVPSTLAFGDKYRLFYVIAFLIK
jgi:hypothetical protein